MADDKDGRDKQARDQERRQRERMQNEAVTRADEEDPTRSGRDEQLGDLDGVLANHDYPVTTEELIDAYGDTEILTQDGTESLEEVLTDTGNQTFDSPDEVRARIRDLISR